MGTLPSQSGSSPVGEKRDQRRSQRVLIGVPVVVIAQVPDKPPVSETTRTLVVNAHGALILLGFKVSIGQLLTLRHAKTEEEQACRVVNVGPSQAGKAEVGIEFMKPAPRFWRIAFPPADWSPRSPEAKSASAQSAQQRRPVASPQPQKQPVPKK